MGDTSTDVLSGHDVLGADLCMCVCIYSHGRGTHCLRNRCRLPWSLTLLCLTPSMVITQKRNVIGLWALCHCLALSIKLTTIPNPPIVHAEPPLSATVSWQSGENEHSLLFSNNLIMKQCKKKTLCNSLLLPLAPLSLSQPVRTATSSSSPSPSSSSSSSSSPPSSPL